MKTAKLPVKIADEVKQALEDHAPVVALETTIISHGMSYPFNVQLASEVEEIIRHNGAVPATIAVINGIIKIGISESEIEFIATERSIRKASRRDLPIITAAKLNGSTTVSGTMFCAQLAGIKVFVTGGIGGVHKGAPETFDISADLTELMSTSVAVVCAGAKSILDLPLTLERLETNGVPVIGYQTDEFPAFFSRESGLPVDYNAQNTEIIAAIMKNKWDLGLTGGIVVGCPIPSEDEIPAIEMDKFIKKALKEAEKENIKGKYLTPFMLQEIHNQTRGRSVEANTSLVKNNAQIGAEIARHYSKLTKRSNK